MPRNVLDLGVIQEDWENDGAPSSLQKFVLPESSVNSSIRQHIKCEFNPSYSGNGNWSVLEIRTWQY